MSLPADLLYRWNIMPDPTKNELFAHLFTEYRQRIFSFIRVSTVGSTIDAEEILQEVCIVAWQKFEKFSLDTDFVRWVNQISYFQVLKHRRKEGGRPAQFSEHFMERIAQEMRCCGDMLQRERKNTSRLLGKAKRIGSRFDTASLFPE